MTKITMIIGEPCVGKSTLVKAIMALDSWRYDPTIKYLPCHWGPSRCILGRYDDLTHQFPGTDRMSMACQPHAISFIRNNPEVSFLFEGDRLGNEKMVRAMKALGRDLIVYHVRVWDDELAARRLIERPNQDARFVASRATKIRNLRAAVKAMGVEIQNLQWENSDQLVAIAQHIRDSRF